MALKVELKPGERFILGDSVITNDDQRTRLFVEGDAPILREKDILRLEDADTPCKKIYIVLQMMYLSVDPKQHHPLYFQLIDDVLRAAPSTAPYIEAVNSKILTGEMYKGLKEAKKLIEYEGTLLNNAKTSPSL
ncbi:flagellar biosynthesis repressor FlbT [Parvibaculum sedimenti]|uniref:Flagellar biosynthesis repressor FlbT n=2 Tax=Parvibaculum sedimenti TaxID=2608632 RepID=A0A6N6VGR7_9HYPH|nr:flagellar biosynthesis repressor FlbT [Parvibaculum sedimenti]KAB7739109.1 flagellar biosynthesis repressor FlbT [Parvibaculum sedimenti]